MKEEDEKDKIGLDEAIERAEKRSAELEAMKSGELLIRYGKAMQHYGVMNYLRNYEEAIKAESEAREYEGELIKRLLLSSSPLPEIISKVK